MVDEMELRMRRLILPFAAVVVLGTAPAVAAGLKVAVVAPADGPFALLGKQIVDGAGFEAKDHGSQIIVIPETCEAGDGEKLTKAILDSGAEAAIGFLCTESLEASIAALNEANIPALTVSVRSDILMEDAAKNNWPLFRLVPGAAKEATKISDVILDRWKDKPLALIDDGTIHGRELVEAVRASLEKIGLSAIFIDTYRPSQEQQVALVRRLAKSGATHVFVGGDRADMAVMARNAASEKIGLTFLGGETLYAPDQPVPLQSGVLAVALPDYARQPQAAEVTKALSEAGIVAEGYVLPAFAARTLLEAAKDLAGTDDIPLRDAVARGKFETVIGPISFDTHHELAENPYQLLEWRDGRFSPAPPAVD